MAPVQRAEGSAREIGSREGGESLEGAVLKIPGTAEICPFVLKKCLLALNLPLKCE
jgi:hypothetical protein